MVYRSLLAESGSCLKLLFFTATWDWSTIFMSEKEKLVTQMKDKEWLQDLASLVDIRGHLSTLNTKMAGWNRLWPSFMTLPLKWSCLFGRNRCSVFLHLEVSSQCCWHGRWREGLGKHAINTAELKHKFQDGFSDLWSYKWNSLNIMKNMFSTIRICKCY